jgi:acylglycerol lipase
MPQEEEEVVVVAVVTPVHAAFMSYARFDDQHDAGWLTRFRERLSTEVQAQTGNHDFEIFQDRKDIAWGQNWQQRIDDALDTVPLLLVIITPSFFSSSACRHEVNKFLDRERALDRHDLILSVYYISAREMDDPMLRASNELAKVLASRQLADLRQLRGKSITSPRVRKVITQLAAQLASRVQDMVGQQAAITTSSGRDVEEAGVADHLEGYLTGVRNVELYWQGWRSRGQVTGVVLLCHGAFEHSGRYKNVVNALVPDGWAVYGLDLRGHGKSHGEKAHVDSFSDWVEDFDRFKREVTGRHLGLPVFILGHSLGGQIALAYALDHPQSLHGLVLSAPYLAAKLPQIVQDAGKGAARFLPTVRVPWLVDQGKISKDREVRRGYKKDPLVYRRGATLAMADIVARQFDFLIEGSRSLQIPVLIQYGADDKIAEPDGSWRLYHAYGSDDKNIIPYPELWHEIYNEPEHERQRPLNDLREWLANHR